VNHYEFQLLPEDKTITVSEEHHDVEGLLSRTFAREFPGVRTALVCGPKSFSDREFAFLTLDALDPDCLLEGNAKGPDELAREWAKIRGKEVISWRQAGMRPDLVVAFPGANGIADFVERALAGGIRVLCPVKFELKEV
jgi:hypothetical protein